MKVRTTWFKQAVCTQDLLKLDGVFLPSVLPLPSFPSPPFPYHFLFFPSHIPFLLFSPFPLDVGPLLNQQGGLGSAVSCSSWVQGGAPAENEFGALRSCQKATGSNHFEYFEVHVLYYVEWKTRLDLSWWGVLIPRHPVYAPVNRCNLTLREHLPNRRNR